MVSFAPERIKDGTVTDQAARDLIQQLLDSLIVWSCRLEEGELKEQEQLRRAI